MRLDGFGLLVEDMANMIRFYRDVLGFEIREAENDGHTIMEATLVEYQNDEQKQDKQ